MAQIFGYARVSTREQNEARQLMALREFGVEDERIFTDRQSGKDFDRPRLEVPPAFAEVYRRWNSGEMSSRAAAERLGISQPTFLRWVRETP